MTAPRKEIIARVRRWVEYADDDLLLAEHSLTLGEKCPYQLVAYHAQQCAEKYLKAYLVLRGVDFPHTHNIARLLELCLEESAAFSGLEDAEQLSPYAVLSRYPGEDDPVTEAEARAAVRIAKRVREAVRILLND